MDDPVLDMLARIRDRPALYLGRHSAEALFLFLAGYATAVGDLTGRDTSRYRAFVEGLYAKYGYGGGGHSWAWVLGQAAGGDAAGLDLFFAELTAYQQRHAERPVKWGVRRRRAAAVSENVSTLEAACDQYVGRTLVVEPYYGYGWYHPPGGPFGDHGVPTPFHIRVERVYSYKEERRGVLVRVTEPGFVYDGFWLVSMTRHTGVWNFTDRPAAYNLLLCSEEPVEGKEEDSPEYGKLWPVWHLRGQLQASGFGRIAESLQCCAEYDAKQDEEGAAGGRVFRCVGTVRLDRGDR